MLRRAAGALRWGGSAEHQQALCRFDADHAPGARLLAALHEGGDAAGFRQDVAKPEDCEAAVEFAQQTYGALHLAVNNAGVAGAADAVGESDLDAWVRTV